MPERRAATLARGGAARVRNVAGTLVAGALVATSTLPPEISEEIGRSPPFRFVFVVAALAALACRAPDAVLVPGAHLAPRTAETGSSLATTPGATRSRTKAPSTTKACTSHRRRRHRAWTCSSTEPLWGVGASAPWSSTARWRWWARTCAYGRRPSTSEYDDPQDGGQALESPSLPRPSQRRAVPRRGEAGPRKGRSAKDVQPADGVRPAPATSLGHFGASRSGSLLGFLWILFVPLVGSARVGACI